MVEGTEIRWKTKSEARAKDYAQLLDYNTVRFDNLTGYWIVEGHIRDELERVVTDCIIREDYSPVTMGRRGSPAMPETNYTPREKAYLKYKEGINKLRRAAERNDGVLINNYHAEDLMLEILMLCHDFGEEVDNINLHLGDMLRIYLRPTLERWADGFQEE